MFRNSRLSHYRRDRSGNMGVIGAIAVLPLMMGAGIAIEYTLTTSSKAGVQQAIDAATLATARVYSDSFDETKAKAAGVDFFHANCGVAACGGASDPTFTITPGQSVVGDGALTVKSNFGSVANVSDWTVKATATVGLKPRFTDFYFGVDVSESLGIASGTKAQSDLMALTKPFVGHLGGYRSPDGCAFACHTTAGFEPYKDKDGNLTDKKPDAKAERVTTYELSQLYKIPIRHDVLQTELYDALDVVLSKFNGTHADQVGAALYVMSEDFELLSKPTANSGNLKAAFADHKISITRGLSKFNDVLPKIAADIGKTGTGVTKKDRQKVVIIVTDGVNNNKTGGSDVSALDSKSCDAFKANGVRVVVVHVTYPDLKGNGLWDSIVDPVDQDVAPALKACASPNMYVTSGKYAEIAADLVRASDKSVTVDMSLMK